MNQLYFRRLICVIVFFAAVLLHAEQVTYTVSSSSSVEMSGTGVEGSYAEYEKSSTTGAKGQMTSGNFTRLRIYDFVCTQINSVTLEMRSNSKSGAGSLRMSIGEDNVWVIENQSFSKKGWNGSFSSQLVPITYVFKDERKVASGEVIEIYVEASENSLYVESYTIDYTPAVPQAHYVRLLTGTSDEFEDIHEKSPGAGVLLPDYDYNDGEWCFVGWTDMPVYEADNYMNCYKGGERYFPVKNTALYALYATADTYLSQNYYNNTSYLLGEYMIVETYSGLMAYGSVDTKTGKLATLSIKENLTKEDDKYTNSIDAIISNCIYNIDFLPDSLLTIYNASDRSYVGFPTSSGNRLTKTKTEWSWRELPDKTMWIYHKWSGGQIRSLFVEDNQFLCTMIVPSSEGIVLFDISEFPDRQNNPTKYTCLAQKVEDDLNDGQEEVFTDDVIVANNQVHNPYNKLVMVFDVYGKLVAENSGNISLDRLSCGVYIIVIENTRIKLFVP